MRSRGPRGLATGRPLKPIAWGEVQWDTGVPSWRVAGGEFGGTTPAVAGLGPYTTAVVLARRHDPDRLHVQVASQATGYAYEEATLRQPNGCLIYTADTATPFSVLVFEER